MPNVELIQNLLRCVPIVESVSGLYENIHQTTKKEKDYSSARLEYLDKMIPWYWNIGIFFVLFIILLTIAENIPLADTLVQKNDAFYYLILIFNCGMAVGLEVCLNLIIKKKNNETSGIYKSMAEKETATLNQLLQSVKDLFSTEEGKFAKNFLPPDYFYPAAVEKFLYYLRNGHADTMKEAVKEYDTFLHHQKLEYEATMTRKNAERAANAAEQSAQASLEMAESLRNIEFWSIYNAYVSSTSTTKINVNIY